MELLKKLEILADAAKYDAACTSSGLNRAGRPGTIGSTTLGRLLPLLLRRRAVHFPSQSADDQRVCL